MLKDQEIRRAIIEPERPNRQINVTRSKERCWIYVVEKSIYDTTF
jgi:hypothetical protein